MTTTLVAITLMLSVPNTVHGQDRNLGKPNILFILVDDLAWSDLGCYGHAWHHTPHIDTLASTGMRFTNGYSPAPICSAARASFLTGKTPARLGFEFVTKDKPGRQTARKGMSLLTPPFTLNLPLEHETIADQLSACGYETAYFGKWHLNSHHKRYLGWSPTHGPSSQGFEVAEEDFGSHPYQWKRMPPSEISQAGVFPDDSMVNRVCRFLKRDHESPFFAMASSFYVHTPVKTQCSWLVDKYDQRIPANATNRSNRIQYAAFLETLDHHVGELVAAIEASNQRESTLIVLMSDNGGHPEYTTNAPLRGSKWNLYEGGIRVPLLVSLPGKIEAGTVSDHVVVGYDLLPTLVEVGGGQTLITDGVSFLPTMLGVGQPERESVIFHFPYYHPEKGFEKAVDSIGVGDFQVSKTRPHSAIRRGNYKLLHFAENDRSEVYDVAADVAEQIDLSESRPMLTKSLKEELMKKLSTMNARRAVPPATR